MVGNDSTETVYPIWKTPVFDVGLRLEGGKTKVVSKGLLAPLLRNKVSKEMDFFDGKKYIGEIWDNDSLAYDCRESGGRGKALVFSTWMPPIPSPAFSRLVRSRMAGVFGKLGPEQMTVSITEECPNHCIHCALPDKHCHSKLTVEETKQVIDDALEMGVTNIIFDGGEPLTYDGLEELIAYVDPQKAICSMFTSGVGMTAEKALSLKKAGLFSVTFSFDHASEEKHDRMRGRSGVFNEAVQGVKYALSAGLFVNMYNVIGPHNIDEAEELYKLAAALGVHELSFYEIVPTGRWIDRPESVFSESDRVAFGEFVRRHENDDGPRLFPGPVIVSDMGCMAGRQWLHVTPEGDILPCACIPRAYGNIRAEKDALKKAWQRIRKDKAYSEKQECLMRNPDFRKEYIQL